ncbi:MAG: PLDc_N domain-containing protein [Microbacteriaceae bacterium]|nr:PLDc_N domain-containing protein [Microbacteriaceae bacterium]
MIRLVIPLVLTAVAVFTIVDIVMIAQDRVKHLPKWAWVLLAIFTSVLGAILWWTIGRERRVRSGGSGGSFGPPQRARPVVGPEDDPSFIDNIEQRRRNREQEERIRDLERQLRDLDDEPKQPKPEKPEQ